MGGSWETLFWSKNSKTVAGSDPDSVVEFPSRMLESAVNGDSAGKLKTMCESIGLDVWDASRRGVFPRRLVGGVNRCTETKGNYHGNLLVNENL